jgi:hypothetical protein
MLKKNFDIHILYEFLNKICDKTIDASNTYYIIDRISYKKIEYHDILNDFISKIEPYYTNSKKFYITRKLDYNKFLTLIRQICKFSNIYYYNKIFYDKSKYNIKYYIQII